jgi:uncharacterized protein YjbJ (UPF0337 family)
VRQFPYHLDFCFVFVLQLYSFALVSGEPSKVTGHKDEILGSVKSSVGGLLHNDEMKAKGEAQHASGVTEVNAAVAKQKADAAVEGGKGNVKSVIGSLTGNDKMVSCSVQPLKSCLHCSFRRNACRFVITLFNVHSLMCYCSFLALCYVRSFLYQQHAEGEAHKAHGAAKGNTA